MADPITDPRPGRLTPLSYAVDDAELDIVIAIMQRGGFSTPAAVMDCALWKLGLHFDVGMPRGAFELGRKR